MPCASTSGKLIPLSELSTFIVHSFNKSGLSVSVGQAVLMVGGGRRGPCPQEPALQLWSTPGRGCHSGWTTESFSFVPPHTRHPHPSFSHSPSPASATPPNVANNSRHHPPYLRPQHPPPLPASNLLPIHQFISQTLKLQFTRLKAETQVLSLALETFLIWLQLSFPAMSLTTPTGHAAAWLPPVSLPSSETPHHLPQLHAFAPAHLLCLKDGLSSVG